MWAPLAATVELELDGQRLPMRQDGGGWFATDAAARADADYRYRLDGGDPLPDPRSPWQPGGVDGPSRLVDHGAFTWTDGGWTGRGLQGALIYEIHAGAFTPEGTFEAAIERLDYLVELGVTHLELMPIAEFSGDRGWGYDGVDLYAPYHAYGGPAGLKRLVDACHQRGLAVILDVVYNHLGTEGDHLRRFAPYLREDRQTEWGPSFDIDGPNRGEIRAFLIDNALMWLRDYHLDGLRLDASDRIHDSSPVHLLAEMSEAVAGLAAQTGRRRLLLAETDLNDPIVVTPRDRGGWDLDAQWLDDFQHALHALVTGEGQGYYSDFGRVADLATSLRDAYVYAGRYSEYHGVVRGRPAGEVDGNHFIAFAQNHDQVGNRPAGERLAQLVDQGRQQLAAAVVLLSPYVPLLFMGDEWGASTPFLYFADHRSPELREAVRVGRRRDLERFGWNERELVDPESPEAFQMSKLRWEERDEIPHRRMLEWYRMLVSLRRETPQLTDGRRDLVEVMPYENARRLQMVRGPIRLTCDFAQGAVEIAVNT